MCCVVATVSNWHGKGTGMECHKRSTECIAYEYYCCRQSEWDHGIVQPPSSIYPLMELMEISREGGICSVTSMTRSAKDLISPDSHEHNNRRFNNAEQRAFWVRWLYSHNTYNTPTASPVHSQLRVLAGGWQSGGLDEFGSGILFWHL